MTAVLSLNKVKTIIFMVIALFFSNLILISPVSANSQENTPVLEASKGVYRIWVAINLTSELPSGTKEKVMVKGYLGGFPFRGEELTLFIHDNDVYAVAGFGSGFVINTNNIVTNHHVVKDIVNGNNVKGFVLKGNSNGLDLREFTVDWSNETKDLAVLNVPSLSSSFLTFSSQESIYKLAKVSSIGFPGDSDILGGIENEMGYFSSKIRQGTLTTLHKEAGTEVKIWEHNAAISGGNSGGPLVNACGEIVGVNSSGVRGNSNVLFAVAIEELIPVLNSRGISYTQSNSKCSIGNATPVWLMPLMVVFLIALIGFAVFILRLKSQIKNGHAPVSKSRLIRDIIKKLEGDLVNKNKDEDGHIWQVDDQGREYRFDPVKGMIYRDKNPNNGDNPPIPPSPKPIVENFATIKVSLNGSEVNQKRLSQGESVVIGRSQQSDIVIDDSYVSGSHLKVSFEQSGLFVTDLGSRNGTFLNGNKITQNIKVVGSQSFTLAGNLSDFRVSIIIGNGEHEVDTQKISLVPLKDSSLPVISLPVDSLVSVGRSSSNSVIISRPKVSSVHCHLRAHANGFVVIEDNNSMNGTYIGDLNNRIAKAELKKGQVVYFADADVAYQYK